MKKIAVVSIVGTAAFAVLGNAAVESFLRSDDLRPCVQREAGCPFEWDTGGRRGPSEPAQRYSTVQGSTGNGNVSIVTQTGGMLINAGLGVSKWV
jgi:hypothetical protein